MSLTQPTSVAQGEAAEKPLRRVQIREVLLRHTGSIARIAESLGVTSVTVSMVMRGKMTSKRVYAAAEAKALELLQLEKKQQSEKQEQPQHAEQ